MAKQGAKTAVPRLRFPEFRNALPWNAKLLKDICAVNPSNDGLPDSFVYIDLESVEDGQLKAKNRIEKSDAPSRAQRHLRNGDVIFQVVRPYQRNNLYVDFDDGQQYVASTGYAQLRAKDSERFLYQAVHVDSFVEGVIAKCTGSNYPAINSSDLAEIQLFAPHDAAEQQKIADCLTSLDEVIAAQGRKVEALKAHKRGLMQQLFPREGETRPRLRFPEFRDAPEWTFGKASDIVDVLQGYGFPERFQGGREGEFPFYKVSDISACVDAGGILLDEANNHIDADVLKELSAKLMPVGSTVFAKIGEAIRSNKRAITSRPCLVDNNAAGVKAITGLAHDRFVYYLWCQVPLIEYAGGVVPAVNKSAIEQIPVCYPKLDEQHRIADCLSSLDTQITAESDQLAAFKTHKQGLMQQLFPAQEADQ